MFKLFGQALELITIILFLSASAYYFFNSNMQCCLLTFIAASVVMISYKLDRLLEEKRSVRDSY